MLIILSQKQNIIIKRKNNYVSIFRIGCSQGKTYVIYNNYEERKYYYRDNEKNKLLKVPFKILEYYVEKIDIVKKW